MGYQEWLDSIPLGGIFVAFIIGAVLVSECGYRLGHWWQFSTPGDKEGPNSMIVGSLLGLLAFLLAVTMGMATDRFDARRGLIVTEANAIGTTYLRTGFLSEPASSQTRRLLREYTALRTVGDNTKDVPRKLARSLDIHSEMWAITEDQAKANPESVVVALFIESLNDLIDIHELRVTVGIYGRLPANVFLLLLVSSVLTLGMVGYSAGLTGRRSPPSAVVMIIVLGAVTTLLLDLDRSRGGLITVNEQPLIDLQKQMSVQASVGEAPAGLR